ncbi:MAG: 2,3-bisphosphoglycerate-dependent phosphoglycerate mutase [Parachlamydiaceae bacterium]
MGKLILMRHGESLWNKKNLFTGWVDVPLSKQGIEDAFEAGRKIADIPIDVAFTSTLVRAQQTLAIAMTQNRWDKTPVFMHQGEGKLEEWARIYSDKALQEIIPVYTAWQLNERMYGALQGLNKAETMDKFGKEQVQEWRRSYRTAPPEGESLEKCKERTLPYFNQVIVPQIRNGKNVLISAHGNSLRSILMELSNLNEQTVVSLEIPFGDPIFFEWSEGKLSPCN